MMPGRNSQLPNKYKYMAQLADSQPVPIMALIDEPLLASWLGNFTAVKAELTEIEQHISITSGAFLTDDLAKIEKELNKLCWNNNAQKQITNWLIDAGFDPQSLDLAVRSASQVEDLNSNSFAGVYHSELNIASVEAVKSAAVRVWRSGYTATAILEKLSAGMIDQSHQMNVIVQQMVNATHAGVAFSCHPTSGAPEPYIEFVEGLGETLVSGDDTSKVIQTNNSDTTQQTIYRALEPLLSAARELLQQEADIEWAYDGEKVWLLQVRPITNIKVTHTSEEPVFIKHPLYGELPNALVNRLPEYAVYFNQKRKPLHDLASQIGSASSAAFILELNKKALDNSETAQQVLELFSSDKVVLDFSGAVRQLVIERDRLVKHLLSLMIAPEQIHLIVVRDFIKGQYGIISRQLFKDNKVTLVAEVSEDGLLAMNRGSAVSHMITLDEWQETALFNQHQLTLLHDMTASAIDSLGDVQIEWVLSNGDLYALDYSAVHDANLELSENGKVMSQGFSRGKALLMDSDQKIENYSVAPSMSLTDIPDAKVYGSLFDDVFAQLETLSEPPIVFSKRPYAALASLLPYVSGFVFEKGSLLCHLGVLLREKKLPAVCDEVLFNQTDHGDFIELNTLSKN